MNKYKFNLIFDDKNVRFKDLIDEILIQYLKETFDI